jgi:hypothetical protein
MQIMPRPVALALLSLAGTIDFGYFSNHPHDTFRGRRWATIVSWTKPRAAAQSRTDNIGPD